MEKVLSQAVLFLLVIAGVEGLGESWKLSDFSRAERTMKTILDSCYENDSSSNPVVVLGDFTESIDKLSIIRINNLLKANETSAEQQLFHPKASKAILMLNSLEKLISDLQLLEETELWDHTARFFIIAKNKETCADFEEILKITWRMDILNAIYMCADTMNATDLYTLNPIANYAPHPWKRLKKLKKKNSNVFHQIFDENISCENLNFDKTRILNGYNITAVGFKQPGSHWMVGENYFEDQQFLQYTDPRILRLIIKGLNARGSFEFEIGKVAAYKRLVNGTSDVYLGSTTLDSFLEMPFFFPHQSSAMVAVIRLSPEMSTLEKIFHLWSTPVLIAAATSMIVLFLILALKNRNLSSAILDIVRLLTYTSIHTDTRSHSMRIYFTTMLILMVISNGVFQGKIAAFLTKQERTSGIATIEELVKLKYKMYTSGSKRFADARCPKCNFTHIFLDDCIDLVLNSTSHVCGVSESEYEREFMLLPLETVTEILNEEFENFKCRRDWPLQKRFNDAIMWLVATGIVDFMLAQDTSVLKVKRQEMEAEWSSAQYKPVKLYKLKFAFQLLAYGLLFATIVFFLEIWWVNYEAP